MSLILNFEENSKQNTYYLHVNLIISHIKYNYITYITKNIKMFLKL